MALIQTEGLVLAVKPQSEADLLVTLFSRELGKVQVAAKGVRKAASRRRALAQPLIHARYLLYEGSNYLHLNQGELISAFPELRQDLEKLLSAQYLLGLWERVLPLRQPAPRLYRLLGAALHLLAPLDTSLVLTYVEAQFLQVLGLRPEVSHCVQCRRPLGAGKSWWALAAGGLRGECCGPPYPGAVLLSPRLKRLLRCFFYLQPAELAALEVSAAELEAIHQLWAEHASQHLEGIKLQRPLIDLSAPVILGDERGNQDGNGIVRKNGYSAAKNRSDLPGGPTGAGGD